MLRFVVAAILVAGAQARCASECSGHGCCGKNDICGCYSNWEGADCSQRTCPYGHAWSDTSKSLDMGHNYAECSNRGTCDRKSGLCSCVEGFTGLACGRMSCPNDCSGHGTCEHTSELAVDTSVAVGGKAFNKYSAWDAGKTRACKCDPYYTGHDCSKRMCPRGDDPLTTEVDVTQTTTTSLQVDEVQNVTIEAVNGNMNGGEVTFTYTDMYNGVWTTRPVVLPLVKTWSNQNAKLQGQQFPWVLLVENTIATINHNLLVDTTDNSYYYEWTAANVWAKGVAISANNGQNAPRKGDWILVGKTDGAESCLLQVHTTPTAGSAALRIVADPMSGPCRYALAGAATDSAIFVQWSPYTESIAATSTTANTQVDGAQNTVSSFDATTGKLRIAPGPSAGTIPTLLAAATASTTRSLQTLILPGTWVRVTDTYELGRYCDFQVQSTPSTCVAADCFLTVDPNSATSTWVDSNNGAGNPKGSSLCASNFACEKCALSVLADHTHLLRDGTATDIFPAIDTTGETYYSFDGAGTMSSFKAGTADDATSTMSPFLWSAKIDAPTGTTGADNWKILQPGVEIHMYDDDSGTGVGTGSLRYVCAGVVSGVHLHQDGLGVLGHSITLESTGAIAGATPTQCSTLTRTVFQGVFVVRAANSIIFDPAADDTTRNPYYFNGLTQGDVVAGFALADASDDDAVNDESRVLFTVDRVVSSYTESRGLKFKTGSKPNGGGMYPVLPIHRLASNYQGEGFANNGGYIQVAPTTLFDGAILQAYHTSQAGSYWAGSTATVAGRAVADSAFSESAADVKRVLEELPNHVIDTVDVTMTSAALGLYAYSVTFSGARNAGDQHNIIMNGKGCNVDGCQPRYTGVRTQKARAFQSALGMSTATPSTITTGIQNNAASVSAIFASTTYDYATTAGGDEIVLYRAAATFTTDTSPAARHLTTATPAASATTTITTLYPTLGAVTTAADTTILFLKALGDHDNKPFDHVANADTDMSTDRRVLFKSATYEITRGTKEGTECSGRGNCDYDTGLCECTEGYTGEACATQTCLL
jgi:hypothetical protein